jgi:phosphoglycolate phosphatase
MSYRMVLWDFDGTLADTWACGLDVYKAIASRHGFHQVADAEAARRMTTLQFLRHHGIPLLRLRRVIREWQIAMRGGMESVALFPGVVEALKALQERGCILGILSSNSCDNIRTCLRARGIEGLFEVIDAGRGLFGKARGIRRIVRRQGLSRGEVLYVGYETRDVEAAREADVDSAAVGWGLHPLEILARSAPTHLVERAEQILHLVEQGTKGDLS